MTSVSLFKQNAPIFFVLKSSRLLLPLNPQKSTLIIILSLISFPWNKTLRSSWIFYPLRYFLGISQTHRKVHFIIWLILCALRIAHVTTTNSGDNPVFSAPIKSLQINFLQGGCVTVWFSLKAFASFLLRRGESGKMTVHGTPFWISDLIISMVWRLVEVLSFPFLWMTEDQDSKAFMSAWGPQ